MLDRRAGQVASVLPQALQALGTPWGANKSSKKGRIALILDAMHGLLERDLAMGTSIGKQYCDACQRVRNGAGFVVYGRYTVCNQCATEFEVANARGLLTTIGQFVRDKNFGETARYALDTVLTG
jgi:hypothetical protein